MPRSPVLPAQVVTLAALLALSPVARALDVVVTLPPLHSLVAGVTDGVQTPRLLLDRGASGHHTVLKPSTMGALQGADLLVWIGPGLESYLVKPLRNPAPGRRTIEVSADVGLKLLPLRRGLWSEDHDQESAGAAGRDMHLWLDPRNAAAIVKHVAAELARLDPEHADRYRQNAVLTRERLVSLDRQLARQLAPVADQAFIVFHDAFQYLEARYGLVAIAAISDNDEQRPGAAHLSALRRLLGQRGVGCVFLEPGADSRLAAVVVEDTDARIAHLDPLGLGLAPGPDLYFQLLRDNATTLAGCLSQFNSSAASTWTELPAPRCRRRSCAG